MTIQMQIVLSRGQSDEAARRALEERLAADLSALDGVDMLVIPHLYDVAPDRSAVKVLQALKGDFLLASWLYPRAAHWILDHKGVRGQFVDAMRGQAGDNPIELKDEDRPSAEPARVLTSRPQPERLIYHLDLRQGQAAESYLSVVKRLVAERLRQRGGPDESDGASKHASQLPGQLEPASPRLIEEKTTRRWYPVIDFSRCTNCLECIDFCLFGVYGIDQRETILVEQPDNCRQGCPACSRVCPENAIMFPQHKSPAIAGDPEARSPGKIDLSELFGKPTQMDEARREREDHLRRAGQDLPESTNAALSNAAEPAPKQSDELDDLIDELDELDL